MTVASPTPSLRSARWRPQEGSIAALSASYQALLRRFSQPLLFACLLLALLLLVTHPDRLPIYLAAVVPAVVLVQLSSTPQRLGALPVFPLYVALQALSFASPLFAAEINADRRVQITDALLASCVVPLLLWFIALAIGWSLTPLNWGRRRPAVPLTKALVNPGFLPHASLAVAAGLQLLISAPLFFDLLGTFASGLLTPLRTLAGLAAMTGVFSGTYSWARGRLRSRLLWLALFLVPLLVSITSLLLSSLQGMLFAALLGLWLGRARAALGITLASLLLLGFLNAGKASIRAVYWSGGAFSPTTANPIALLQEWTAASFEALSAPPEDRPGNLFTERYNNLQNLLYVQQALASGTPTLDGESLTVIPQVLIPRILNPDKVRSQQGQVLLNLHFGRQRTVEETERSYIAWGFLAEGVGNFGAIAGPLVMGALTGSLLRITENLGRGQFILSSPGLLSFSLAVLWLTSYEMAASTFAAAALQILVIVLFVGWWSGSRPADDSTRIT